MIHSLLCADDDDLVLRQTDLYKLNQFIIWIIKIIFEEKMSEPECEICSMPFDDDKHRLGCVADFCIQ